MSSGTRTGELQPSEPQPSFSLVLATIGRTDELANFLLHLDAQTYRCFELIVVDQNPDDRLVPLLGRYRAKFPVQHLRSATGVSRSRNVGLKAAIGDVVAFPDDDCWYPPDLLEQVATYLAQHSELDGITARPIDRAFSRFHTISGPIDRQNVFLRCSEFTVFLRRVVITTLGGFDERLGLGSNYGLIAAEGSDYLIRAIASGFRLSFNASIAVFHKDPGTMYDAAFNRKAKGYNRALGYVMRKHCYPIWYVARTWIRALGGMCVSGIMLNLPKLRYHYNVLLGRINGYFERI